jgi:hypothetical protein
MAPIIYSTVKPVLYFCSHSEWYHLDMVLLSIICYCADQGEGVVSGWVHYESAQPHEPDVLVSSRIHVLSHLC